jgi:aspartate carbamoyltransferase catalytic subunit
MDEHQQVFLRDAMRQMNLTREALAARIAVRRRALDTWLLPAESQEFRSMPDVVRQFLTEIMARETGAEYAQSVRTATRHAFFDPARPALLSVDQFNRQAIDELFQVVDLLQPIARRNKTTRVLEGAVLGNLFFEASTRTRVSFASAFCRLGGSVCDTTGFTFSSMAKGESIYDTSRVMSGYVDALVVRHPDRGSVAEFAAATNVPIINGGDGPGEHPTQALLDLYTIQREFSRLGRLVDGSHIALVGDLRFGRTVHSLIKLLSLYRGLKFTLIAPVELEMPRAILDSVASRGHVIETASILDERLGGVDVLYATRIQKERFTGEIPEDFAPTFQVNREVLDRCCNSHTIVMHPLPRDSRPGASDLSTDLDQDPRLAIFRQTDNGIAVRMAIFAVLLGVDHLLARSMRDATWRAPRNAGPNDAVFAGFD